MFDSLIAAGHPVIYEQVSCGAIRTRSVACTVIGPQLCYLRPYLSADFFLTMLPAAFFAALLTAFLMTDLPAPSAAASSAAASTRFEVMAFSVTFLSVLRAFFQLCSACFHLLQIM